jgi:thymidylate synthase
MLIRESTLDDLMKVAMNAVVQHGEAVASSRGANRELRGVLLKLTNPLARLSHSETKGKMFSPLGELAWYLSGSNLVEFIAYYIPMYRRDAEDDGTIHGAYGPRLFREEWNHQFEAVVKLLEAKPSTRRAVIGLYDSKDLVGSPKEVPCTCSLQFLKRDSRLDLVVSMRSNDVFRGLPHDVFSFTMIQEILARIVGCELGEYHHFAGSLHLYDDRMEDAEKYADEGWQATEGAAMPPMPLGDPRPSIKLWLAAEAAVRNGDITEGLTNGLDKYWQDLVRLLVVYRYSKDKDTVGVGRIKGEMAFPVYKEFIKMRE